MTLLTLALSVEVSLDPKTREVYVSWKRSALKAALERVGLRVSGEIENVRLEPREAAAPSSGA